MEDSKDIAISLKAAIDALAENMPSAYTPDGAHPADEGIFMAQEIYADCIQTLKELPSAQPEPRWIPCSERMPKEKDAGILKKLGTNKRSEYVLATVEVKGERMAVTACTYDGVWHWDKKYAFPDYKVIAWMPLPEPYRKEGEEG